MYPLTCTASMCLMLLLSHPFNSVTSTSESKNDVDYYQQHQHYQQQQQQQQQQPSYVAEVTVTKPSSYPPKPKPVGHQTTATVHHTTDPHHHQYHLPPVYNHDYHPVQAVLQPVPSSGHQTIYKPIHVIPVTTQPIQQVAVAPQPPPQSQPQQHQQQPSIPLVGAVFGNIPSYMLPWNNLGQIGGLGGLGGGFGGQQCPLGQMYRCRCDNLLPDFRPKSLGMNKLEIVQQSVKVNDKGDKEVSAQLNNGLTIHQRTSTKVLPNDEEIQMHQGNFILKLNEQRYLVIYFDVDDHDFSVKADVTKEPPTHIKVLKA